MLNYEDLIGTILFNVYDIKPSVCNDDFLEMNGKHKFRTNKFGVTWCVICGTLGNYNTPS